MKINRREFGLLTLGATLSATAEPVRAAQKKKVTLALGSTSFAWFALYVADGAGFFSDEGLDLELIVTNANQTPIAAMLSGGVDLSGIGIQAGFAARAKKLPIKLVAPVTSAYTSTLFIRKDVAKRLNVSRQSPLPDRVKALRGLNLATTAIGSGPHLMYRFLFAQNGMNADKDATVVPTGDASPTLAAMSRGIIDVACFSPPVPEKAVADGYAEILIDFNAGDVPEATGMTYTALIASEEKFAKDPDTLSGIIRAMDKAYKLTSNDPKRAASAAKAFIKGIDPSLYEQSVRSILGSVPTVAEISSGSLDKAIKLLAAGGVRYDLNPDDLLMNDFVRAALSK